MLEDLGHEHQSCASYTVRHGLRKRQDILEDKVVYFPLIFKIRVSYQKEDSNCILIKSQKVVMGDTYQKYAKQWTP